LESIGFTEPTEIQTKAIPYLLKNSGDFIGLAATGTGKTAAFGVPLIENIDATMKTPQALILSPTRELAIQIVDQLKKLSSFKKIKIAAIYGGSSYRKQIEDVKKGVQIVVATPGRLIDLLEQNVFNLHDIKTLVLDEADEMISMGFRDSLEEILKRTHSEDANQEKSTSKGPLRAACKTWLFSATMSPGIKKLTQKYLETPFTIEIQNKGSLSTQITQLYFTVKDNLKLKALTHLLDALPEFYGIIFCETKLLCAEVEEQLTKRGYFVDSLHGDKQQKEREWTLKKFKAKDVKVIVATDVAARGLDVSDLTHVVNFSLPWDVESYVHRIGRTGRNGKTGYSYSLVSPRELSTLRAIHQKTKANLVKGTIPTFKEVITHKLKMASDQLLAFENHIKKDVIEDFKTTDEYSHLEKLTKEELIIKFLNLKLEKNRHEEEIPFDFLNGRIPKELTPGAKESSGRSQQGEPRRRDFNSRGRSGGYSSRRNFGSSSGGGGGPKRFQRNEEDSERSRGPKGPRGTSSRRRPSTDKNFKSDRKTRFFSDDV
ncbi:MAG: DEAD/DEAH box helicase, partial [Bdellovibrionales bacterium]|nr:DEAD/DEAH box helicase [Bdellovibrionales bacterium]